MTMTTYEMVERLRAEALVSEGCEIPPTSKVEEITATLIFFSGVHTPRDYYHLTMSVEFVQFLCMVASDGLNLAKSDEGEESTGDVDYRLRRLWWFFTTHLAAWVRLQPPSEQPLWYNCFEVPQWFVKEAHGNR
jgi:hypothetical protein